MLFHAGYSYETLNTARSALSNLCELEDGHSVGHHPMIIRFMTGVFNLRPTKPKYTDTWDVSKVLCYLKTLSPVEKVSLKLLSYKLAMLLALTQASRSQSISLITLDGMKKDEQSFTMYYSGLLKQCRKGRKNPILTLKKYTPDRRLCVFHTLIEYLSRTRAIRGDEKRLFISYIKPFKAVASTTVSRWIKGVMKLSGIDIDVYKSHSTRGASTSKAKDSGVPLPEILKVAGWASDRTFADFYDKPVTSQEQPFQEAVLK